MIAPHIEDTGSFGQPIPGAGFPSFFNDTRGAFANRDAPAMSDFVPFHNQGFAQPCTDNRGGTE